MELTITGKQVRVTPALQKYIHERVQKAEKYLSQPAHLIVTLKTEKYRKIAEAHLNLNGRILQAEEETDAMPASVDKVMTKIERQLNRHKDRNSDHRVRREKKRDPLVEAPQKINRRRGPVAKMGEGRWGASSVEALAPRMPPVRREVVSIPTLTLEEAFLQMTSKKKQFFFFRNHSEGPCGMLYLRADGHLGLIEGVG